MPEESDPRLYYPHVARNRDGLALTFHILHQRDQALPNLLPSRIYRNLFAVNSRGLSPSLLILRGVTLFLNLVPSSAIGPR